MCATPCPALLAPHAPPPAVFRAPSALLWMAASAVQGGLIAWMAVLAQDYYAPLVLFPLLVGVSVGATAAALMRLLQVGHRPTLLAGVVLAVVLSVVGQHYLRYRKDTAQTRDDLITFQKAQQLFPELTQGSPPTPPDSFGQYLRWQAARGRPLHLAGYVARDGAAWGSWVVEGLLVLLAAIAVVLPAVRQPYCSQCRSWYRTVRSGRLNPGPGRRLAALVAVTLPEQVPWLRYRLSDCTSGCGPTRLMLFWEEARGEPASAEIWLPREGRHAVTALLDQVQASGSPEPPNPEGSEPPAPLDETQDS